MTSLNKTDHTNSEISSDVSLSVGYGDDEDDISDLGSQVAAAEHEEEKQKRRQSISSVDHHVGGSRQPASRRSSMGSAYSQGKVPRPSAISLLGAEVTRCALRELTKLLSNQDSSGIYALWEKMTRFHRIQRTIEDSLCKVVDEKYYATKYTAEVLERQFVLVEYEEDFQDALDDENLDLAKDCIDVFRSETLDYLQAVSDELADPLKKMQRRGEPVASYMQGVVGACSDEDLRFFVLFANQMLLPETACIFNHTLWWVVGQEDWESKCAAWVKSASGDNFQTVSEAIQVYESYMSSKEDDENNFRPPIAFIEVGPEKKGLAKLFQRRRSSNGASSAEEDAYHKANF